MIILVNYLEHGVEAFVSRQLVKVFGEHELVATDEKLPGRIRVDFHFKNKDGTDIFVEVTMHKIGRRSLSKILNLYSSLSNLEPPLGKFELIVVGTEVDASAKKALDGLPVRLVTIEELGITRAELEAIRGEQKQFQDRRLSPEEAKLVAMWEAEKKTIIRAKDVQDTLRCSADYTYVLLHNLEQKHWLERISTGLYQFVPAAYGYPEKIPPVNSFVIGAALIKPYYFSYYTANSHYGFTTQMPFTLFIATTKKKPKVEWQSVTFKFVTLSKRKFFGYRLEKAFDAEVCMAEPEKAIVDSFDKPHYAGGVEQLARITWRGLAKVDKAKLVEYAVRMRSHALVQRLGFVVDSLSKEGLVQPLASDLRRLLLKNVGNAPIYLDAKRLKTGSFSNDWRVVDNVPREQLLSEIEVR
jgi:predicted transcriptional regulator of viral defense system